MKLDPNEVLRDYKGRPIKLGENDMTLRDAVTMAVNALHPRKPLSAEQLSKGFKISVKMHSETAVNLTVDEMAFVKERAVLEFNSLVFGRLSALFEGDADGSDECEP